MAPIRPTVRGAGPDGTGRPLQVPPRQPGRSAPGVTRCTECPLRPRKAFVAFTPEEVEFMLNFKSGEMNVEPGTEVLSEGEESPHLFTVLRGFATRSKLLPDGRRGVINFVMAGDLLGMQAEMLGMMTHTITATTQMTLCVFSRRRVWEIFSQSPERAYDLSWIAAREESLLGDRLISIGRMSGSERVAHGLARLYMRGESLELVRDGAMPMPWRQRDFADALGLSLVHTNKILGRLREDGICTWRHRLLEVHDMQALCDLAMLEIETPPRRPLI